MAVYIHCPHCCHPTVVPVRRAGAYLRCRQCQTAFALTESTPPRPHKPGKQAPIPRHTTTA